MKAIDTEYNGYKFRSRLEARWAIFFDTLGIKYEYEKEGFEFDDGERYLPDFWLPDIEAWFEVKPKQDESGYEKCRKLADSDRPVILAEGNIGEHRMTLFCQDTGDSTGGNSEWKGYLRLYYGSPVFSLKDSYYDRTFYDSSWIELGWIKEIEYSSREFDAYKKARSARFEFSEKK